MPPVTGDTTTRRRYCLRVTMVSVGRRDRGTFLIIRPNAIIALSGQHLSPAFHSGLSAVASWWIKIVSWYNWVCLVRTYMILNQFISSCKILYLLWLLVLLSICTHDVTTDCWQVSQLCNWPISWIVQSFMCDVLYIVFSLYYFIYLCLAWWCNG